MIRGRVETGRWRRLYPGVYVLNGAPDTWRQRLLAACLSGGEATVASHRAAARLWQLPGGGELLEISVPRGRRLRRPGVVVHESRLLPAVDVAVVDAIPVTTPARTLIDLAGVLPPERVEEAVDAALSSGLVRRPRLLWRLGDLAKEGRTGVKALRSILEARAPAAPVPASVLETRLRRVLDVTGMPPPLWGFEVRTGGRSRFLDCAWPDLRLAVEADGWAHHSGRAQWESDVDRQNALVAAGWTVLRFSWDEVAHRPERIRSVILQTLDRLRAAVATGPAGSPGRSSGRGARGSHGWRAGRRA
jgi:hypothetical protein